MNPFRGQGLKSEHFNHEVNYIIDNFLVEQAITIYFAPPKHGKSRYSLGLAKYLYENTDKIIQYFDFDNPLSALKERGASKIIEELCDRLDYVHPETAAMTSHEVLKLLVEGAVGDAYLDYIFFFDSITDFVRDVQNEAMAKSFMNAMKRLRNAGATVILLHHTNKNEKNYQGAGVFKSAADNVYFMRQGNGTVENDLFLLDVEAGRFHVENSAFYLDKKTYDLSIVAYDQAMIRPEEQSFIDSIKEVIKKNPDGIGQSQLLAEIGKAKDDKLARTNLAKYTGRFWEVKDGKGKLKLYFLL